MRLSQIALAVIALIGFALLAMTASEPDQPANYAGVVMFWAGGLFAFFRFMDKRVGFAATDY